MFGLPFEARPPRLSLLIRGPPKYSREQVWTFDGGTVPASPSSHVVPVP